MSRHRDTSKTALSKSHFSSQTFVKLAIACAAGLSAALLAVASQLLTGFWLGEAGTWPKQWGGLIVSAATVSVMVGVLVWRFVTKTHKHARHPAADAASVPSKLDPLHTSGAAPWKFILPADAISVYDGHFAASPSLQQLLGLDPSDPIKTLGDLTKRMPDADAVKLLAQVRACLEGRDDSIDAVVRIENSRQQFRKLLIRGAVPVLASYARQRLALGIVIDLGHTDDGAEVSALLYRLFDSVDEKCAVVDANGLLMACNSSLRESLAPVDSSVPYSVLQRLSLVGPNHTPLRNLLALAAKHQRWEGDVWVENHADAGRPQRMYCRIIAYGPQPAMQECYWVSLSYDRPHARDASSLQHRDALTGLPQTRSFIQRLTADLAGARLSDVDVTFIVIRLDNVVDINRGFGVEAGDQVIRIVADRLAVLPGSALARTSGTRFCVILPAGISPDATQAWLDRARKEVTRPVVVDDETIMPELSFDATQIQADETPVQALRRAESGAHTSHHAPANHTALTAESRMRVLNRTAVQRAVSDGGLQCLYQPLVSLNGGDICGAEALVRISVAGEQLAPAAWWPAADGLGLLPQIDQWILGKALDDVANWQAEGLLQPGFRLSVNACADTITEAWQAHV
ncbi:EAL domain-containing protein, partial [bacterium]|nr:EAL domain-containing protein [bacterium]